MAQAQPAGLVDWPAGVEKDRGDQRQLQPVVEQQAEGPGGRQKAGEDDHGKYGHAQHGTDEQPATDVNDLSASLSCVAVLWLSVPRCQR